MEVSVLAPEASTCFDTTYHYSGFYAPQIWSQNLAQVPPPVPTFRLNFPSPLVWAKPPFLFRVLVMGIDCPVKNRGSFDLHS